MSEAVRSEVIQQRIEQIAGESSDCRINLYRRKIIFYDLFCITKDTEVVETDVFLK